MSSVGMTQGSAGRWYIPGFRRLSMWLGAAIVVPPCSSLFSRPT